MHHSLPKLRVTFSFGTYTLTPECSHLLEVAKKHLRTTDPDDVMRYALALVQALATGLAQQPLSTMVVGQRSLWQETATGRSEFQHGYFRNRPIDRCFCKLWTRELLDSLGRTIGLEIPQTTIAFALSLYVNCISAFEKNAAFTVRLRNPQLGFTTQNVRADTLTMPILA